MTDLTHMADTLSDANVEITPEQVAAAQRTTAAHARDADDARTLLDMLGIGGA